MKKAPIIFSFAQDLKELYCKTRISGVEHAWIKVAQAYEEAFGNWLVSPKNKSTASTLSDPRVFEAMVTLKTLRDKYPSFDGSIAMKLFSDSMSKRTDFAPKATVISDFNSLLGDPEVESVLYPFRDIITAFSFIQPSDPSDVPDTDAIRNDLLAIQNAYVNAIQQGEDEGDDSDQYRSHTSNVQQRRVTMFSSLLQRFSDDIATAASNSGMDDLANSFRQGVLANPAALAQKVELQNVNQYMANGATRIVKEVLRRSNPEDSEANYNFIKEKAMDFVGAVSPQQVQDVYKRREEGYSMEHFMEEGVSDIPSAKDEPTLSVEDAVWLSPEVLTMLSLTFATYYSRVKTRSR